MTKDRLTAEILDHYCACSEEVDLFKQYFPEGVVPNPQVVAAARELDMNVEWIMDKDNIQIRDEKNQNAYQNNMTDRDNTFFALSVEEQTPEKDKELNNQMYKKDDVCIARGAQLMIQQYYEEKERNEKDEGDS